MEQLNDELKKLSLDWAEKMTNDIEKAFHDPTVGIDGDARKIYERLNAWGWFTRVPLNTPGDEQEKRPSNAEIYILMLAMEKYRQLKWDKDHPKISKWERVTGMALKKPKR